MANKLHTFWCFLVTIKYSALAALVTAALGLLGMGVLGLGLYYAVAFALPPSFPTIDDVRGDWVWPAMIAIGMFWSVAFLMAGVLNRYLVAKNLSSVWRRLIYAIVLWVWAFLMWWVTLNANR